MNCARNKSISSRPRPGKLSTDANSTYSQSTASAIGPSTHKRKSDSSDNPNIFAFDEDLDEDEPPRTITAREKKDLIQWRNQARERHRFFAAMLGSDKIMSDTFDFDHGCLRSPSEFSGNYAGGHPWGDVEPRHSSKQLTSRPSILDLRCSRLPPLPAETRRPLDESKQYKKVIQVGFFPSPISICNETSTMTYVSVSTDVETVLSRKTIPPSSLPSVSTLYSPGRAAKRPLISLLGRSISKPGLPMLGLSPHTATALTSRATSLPMSMNKEVEVVEDSILEENYADQTRKIVLSMLWREVGSALSACGHALEELDSSPTTFQARENQGQGPVATAQAVDCVSRAPSPTHTTVILPSTAVKPKAQKKKVRFASKSKKVKTAKKGRAVLVSARNRA
ncbi:hypothetical protein C8Q75DRAFT_803059 [Abortiporus biennis]|nr:hypothetical protein C8Q75DRAFT_803059 [Abortiporus biennis]